MHFNLRDVSRARRLVPPHRLAVFRALTRHFEPREYIRLCQYIGQMEQRGDVQQIDMMQTQKTDVPCLGVFLLAFELRRLT